jgi:pilus assembly protein CpaE
MLIAHIITTKIMEQRFARICEVLAEENCKYKYFQSLDESIAAIQKTQNQNTLIIMADDGNDENSVSQIKNIFDKRPSGTFLFYISDKLSPHDYKLLSIMGSTDATDWESCNSDIKTFFNRYNSKLDDKVKNTIKSNNIVIAFLGTGGGVGNTTMALETGICLALSAENKGNHKVAVYDMDIDSSSLCDYLNLEPKLDLNEIKSNPRRLDDYMLKMLSSKHTSGIDVFSCSGPYKVDGYKAPDTTILSFLNCLVESYSIVILDIPDRFPVEIDEILKKSDLIFCTGIFSVPSVRNMKRSVDNLLMLDIPEYKIPLIFTDTETNIFGKISHRFDIKSVFPTSRLFFVRRDREFALQCVDAGISMVETQGSRSISQDIKNIFEYIIEKLQNPQ